MYEEIFIAGSGGQGIISLGKILVYSAAEENKYVSFYPSYGAEIRGGTANCMVKISDSFIYSPVLETPTIMTVMNMPSYLKFVKKYIPQRILFINSSLVEEQKDITEFIKNYSPTLQIIKIAVTEIANKLGSTIVSNMVMLGAMIKVTGLAKIDTVKTVISKLFSKKVIELNITALQTGYNLI